MWVIFALVKPCIHFIIFLKFIFMLIVCIHDHDWFCLWYFKVPKANIPTINDQQFSSGDWKTLTWNTIFVFWFNFHWSWILGVQSTINPHWCHQVASHYLNLCRNSSMTPRAVTDPQCIDTSIKSIFCVSPVGVAVIMIIFTLHGNHA